MNVSRKTMLTASHAALPPAPSFAYVRHDLPSALHQSLQREQIQIHNALADVKLTLAGTLPSAIKADALGELRYRLYDHIDGAMAFQYHYPSTRGVTNEALGRMQDRLILRLESLPDLAHRPLTEAGIANEVKDLRGQIADFLDAARRLPMPDAHGADVAGQDELLVRDFYFDPPTWIDS
jgi:hypothetical protein